MIIIVTHAYLINGKIVEPPTPTIIETLIRLKKDFVFLRHSMQGEFNTEFFRYKQGVLLENKRILTIKKPAAFRYLYQIILTLFIVLSLKQKINLFIGISPLNAFSGIILRKIRKVKVTVFYSTDFTTKRFDSTFLNKIYHYIDKVSSIQSDYVWNVSTRIQKIRSKYGVSEEKNIFVPNVPSDDYLQFLANNKNKFHLITLGVIGEQLDFINMFKAIDNLRSRYNILFKIIGAGPKLDEYKKYVEKYGLSEHIQFLGHLSHTDALKEISHSGIGIALYNGKWSFNYYGDSMKCREFFCFGLPVITTDTHSTVDEIERYQAGIVVEMNQEAYQKALLKIIKEYDFYSKNSYELAAKYQGIHKALLKNY